jgi:predicted nuclease of predicted toxin-antitoxin system
MKFLIDENISILVTRSLSKNYDTKSVIEELRGAKDKEIIKLADQENRIIITLDKDFCNLIFQKHLPTQGIILLRLRDESPQNIIEVLDNLLKRKDVTIKKSFVVITETQIRTRAL